MWLTALGADVVKIELPAGDPYRAQAAEQAGGESVLFMALNAGKRSLAVDFQETPAGREVLDRPAEAGCDLLGSRTRGRAACRARPRLTPRCTIGSRRSCTGPSPAYGDVGPRPSAAGST